MNDLIIFIWIVLLLFDSVFHDNIQKLKNFIKNSCFMIQIMNRTHNNHIDTTNKRTRESFMTE